MSAVMSALQAVHATAVQAAFALAAKNGEEFNPDKVTPGPEGFIATAVFAAAVITLGFLLVKRIRRNGYRHAIREDIAAELSEAGTHTGSAPATHTGSTPGARAADAAGGAGSTDASGPAPEQGGTRPDGA